MLRAGQGRTRHDQPGPLRDPNTKWPDRGAAVRRYIAAKLMAERTLEPTVGDLRDDDVDGPIPFYALCEHHAFPFFGHAYVGYIAHEHIIGISKLTRLVRLFARRFTVQERMGREITAALSRVLQAHGVAVYLEAIHLCTQMRGVRESESTTRTTFWRGNYESNPELREEFLNIARSRANGHLS